MSIEIPSKIGIEIKLFAIVFIKVVLSAFDEFSIKNAIEILDQKRLTNGTPYLVGLDPLTHFLQHSTIAY